MNKNIKRMFFVTMLLVLLLGVGTLSAADISNDTTTVDNNDNIAVNDIQADTPVKSVDTTTSKNIKKEETITDLYVSDTNGSDDNNGTDTSPYKTIQKAINQTNSNSTYNIHIAEGTYKGLGNTNLTVNGNYQINFIGDGINKTVFDGEASYRLNDNGGYFWGSSKIWESYLGCTGNWIMNITSGSGKITIKNMTITKTMNTGGASISAYKTSAINNYGNTYIDTVYFKDNMGGVGAATRNRENASIHINNSIFEGNRKADSMGNYGSALYNNGTAIMENSLVFNNYARWGTITSDRNLTLINCTIRDNIGYDGGSTYKYGAGVAIDTTLSAGEHPDPLGEMNTQIINSTFINNEQSDIYIGNSTLLIEGSLFNKSTGIYIDAGSDNRILQNITNNNFINMTASTIATSLSVTTGQITIINQKGSYNLTVDNNTIIPYKDDIGTKIALQLNTNTKITNNNITGIIKISGSANIIENNTINGSVSGSSSIDCRDNNVINNWIHNVVVYGDKAVSLNTVRNTVENNIPVLGQEYTITEDNYLDYFDSNDMMIIDSIEDGSTVYLDNLKNHDLIIKNKNIELTSNENSILENITFSISDNSSVVMKNLQINTNNQKEYVILLNSSENSITFCTINTTIKTPIIINDRYNSISNSQINIIDNSVESNEIVGIDIKSDNNIFSNNILNIESDNNKIIAIKAFNTQKTYVNKNDITLKSTNNMIAIYLNNTNKSSITDINVTSNSSGNIDAINLNNCEENTLSLICNINSTSNVTGITIKSDNKKVNNKLSYIHGTINADNAVGIAFNNTQNNTIQYRQSPLIINANHTLIAYFNNTDNTSYQGNYIVTATDNDSAVLKIENSNNNIFALNVTTNINQQIILNNSNNNLISPVNNVITSNYTPILLYNSNYNNITNLNVTTTESDDCIILNNSKNNQIINNNLKSKGQTGDNTVKIISSTNNIINHNSGYVLITMDNYDEYFTEEELFDYMTTGTVELGSDFYNKSFKFNGIYNVTNPNNYTIYNGSMKIDGEEMTLNNIRINSTNNCSTILLVNSSSFKMSDCIIYHENNDITRTIVITNNVNANFTANNITTLGPEIITEDGIPSTIAIYDNSNQTVLYSYVQYIGMSNKYFYNYITVLSTLEDNGSIVGYYSNEKGLLKWYGTGDYFSLIINMKGKNATGILLDKKTFSSPYGKGTTAKWSINSSIDAEITDLLIIKNSENNKIDYLKITTDKRYTIILDNVTNSNISENYLNSSNTYFAEDTLLLINCSDNIITNNTPLIYTLTDDNYHQYFDENETLNITFSSPKSTDNIIRLGSDLYNKNLTFNQPITLENPGNYTIYNGTLTTTSIPDTLISSGSRLTNIHLNSTDNRETILNLTLSARLTDSTIYHNSKIPTNSIILDNSYLTNNTIILNYSDVESTNNIDNTPIIFNNGTGELVNNIINITSTNENGNTYVIGIPKATRIPLSNNIININSKNNVILVNGYTSSITNNIINITSNNAKLFAFNMSGATTTIRDNIFDIKSTNSTQLIEINGLKSAHRFSLDRNKYTINSNNSTVFLKLNSNNMMPIQIINSNITITSPNINFTDIITTPYNITNNNINFTGKKIIVNQLYNSTRNHLFDHNILNINSEEEATIFIGDSNTGTNTIYNNTIFIKGNYTNTPLINLTNTKGTITNNHIESKYQNGNDAIINNTGLTIENNTPTTTGFKTEINNIIIPDTINVNTVNNIIINITDIFGNEINGTITVTDGETTTKTTNNTIKYKPQTTGEKTLTITYTDPKGKYNTTTTTLNITVTPISLIVDEINATAGNIINITAKITTHTETLTDIHTGKVTFKVNGKTLKDANGKVIYAKVVNGTATIENYTVPEDWTKEGTTIEAVYSGSAQCDKLTSQKTNITVQKSVPTLTTESINTTAGSTITLTATITDNDKTINSGKIVFKINGKTVKDANGKVIYAKVVNNTVSINYVLPESMKAGNYTITATYIGSDYDKLEASEKLTITS